MSELPKRVQSIFASAEIQKLRQGDQVWGTVIIACVLTLPGLLIAVFLPLMGEVFLIIGLIVMVMLALLATRLAGKKERRIYNAKMKKLGYGDAEIERLWQQLKDEEANVDH